MCFQLFFLFLFLFLFFFACFDVTYAHHDKNAGILHGYGSEKIKQNAHTCNLNSKLAKHTICIKMKIRSNVRGGMSYVANCFSPFF